MERIHTQGQLWEIKLYDVLTLKKEVWLLLATWLLPLFLDRQGDQVLFMILYILILGGLRLETTLTPEREEWQYGIE